MRSFLAGVTVLLLAACQPVAESVSQPEPAVPAATAPAIPADDVSRKAVWSALEDRYLPINVTPSDPIEALEWTEVRCNYLAGEFGGTKSAQDRAINARITELGCGATMLAGARVLRRARAADPVTVARLDALLARGAT